MTKSFFRGLSLRFTKWCRKSYAAFKSIGRHVTIGKLKNIVADALLGKQKNVLSICTVARENENDSYAEEWFDPPEEDLQWRTIMLPSPVLKKSCRNTHHFSLYCSGLKVFIHNAFSFFYSPSCGSPPERNGQGWIFVKGQKRGGLY